MKKRFVVLFLALALLLPVMASAAYYRVDTSALKVRLLPEDNAKVLATYEQDYALTVSETKNGWSYVTFTTGREGYVMSQYIQKNSSFRGYITGDETPLRTGPMWEKESIGTLAKGTRVTVLTAGKGYDYVRTPIGTGYVAASSISKKYVKPSGAGNKLAFVPSADYVAWVSNGNRTVNFRTGPALNQPVITELPTATEVYVLSHGQVWDYIQYGEYTGYMMTKFLTTSQPAPDPESAQPAPQPAAGYTAWVTSENQGWVNVHTNPGMGYANAYRADYGAQVTVLNHGATWDRISLNGKTGYILNKYLTLIEPPAKIVPVPAEETPVVTPVFTPYTATVTCTAGEKVNVRKGAGKGYTHIARLDPGTLVTVTSTTKVSGWVAVQLDNGVTGYMMSEFLR